MFRMLLLGLFLLVPEAQARSFTPDTEEILLAQGSTYRQGKRERKRRHIAARSRPRKQQPMRKSNPARAQDIELKGYFGILTGVDGFEETVFTYGGDLTYDISQKVSLDAGLLYWSISADSPLLSISVSMLNIDLGPTYHLPISRAGSLDFGARFGTAQVSVDTSSSLFGVSQTSSDSVSGTLGHLVAGASARSDNLTYGAQVRQIVYGGDGVKSYDGMYLLAQLGLAF